MNKFCKFWLELFGIANLALGIFMPLAVAMLIIVVFSISTIATWSLIIISMMSSLYKAIKIFIR